MTQRGIRVAVCLFAALSALVSAGVYVVHVPDFFVGDDFELIGDTLEGVSPFAPVSTHLRPIIRLHFLLYRAAGSPALFGALSVLLHALAAAAFFLALRAMYGKKVATVGALLFFTCFTANEAVFWASAAAVLYCAIFSCLSLACFVRGRLVAAYLLLGAAAISYELWMVVPLLFLFHRRRMRELLVPFAMVVAGLALHAHAFGAAGASSYGGFSLVALLPRFARFLLPLPVNPSLGLSLVLSAVALGSFAVPRLRLAATLYAASALLFTFSDHVASRFYYFPALAVVTAIALGVCSGRRAVRIAAVLAALALAVAGPWVNLLDGRDYGRRSSLHRELYVALDGQFDRLAEGDRAVVVNRLGPERLEASLRSLAGRPKILFVRGPAIAGMIYPDDAVRISLWPRGLRPAPGPCTGKTVEVGSGEVRSTYCFGVDAR